MALSFSCKLGAVFPDFACETSDGETSFHELLDRAPGFTLLLAYPRCFDAVSVTELSRCHDLLGQFRDLGVQLIGYGGGSAAEHEEWSQDILSQSSSQETSLGFTLVADPVGEHDKQRCACGATMVETSEPRTRIAERLGLLDSSSAVDGQPAACNAVFFIGANRTNRLCTLYPAAVGFDPSEALRCALSLLLTQDFSLATPANWQEGRRLIVAPSVSTDDAKARFCNLEVAELPSGRGYLRFVDPPAAPKQGTQAATPPPQAAPAAAADAPGDKAFRIQLGAVFPDFHCSTTKGEFSFHEYLEREPGWTVLFSHPKDFTPVCTTEIGECHSLAKAFGERGVKLLGLSCDSVSEHHAWAKDVLALRGLAGEELAFPMIADENRSIASLLGMLDPLERDGQGPPMPARAFFLIDSEKRNRLTIIYPATTGRNFDEVLRAVDALLAVRGSPAGSPGAAPAGWRRGERLLAPARAAAGQLEVEGVALPSGRPYLRFASGPCGGA